MSKSKKTGEAEESEAGEEEEMHIKVQKEMRRAGRDGGLQYNASETNKNGQER